MLPLKLRAEGLLDGALRLGNRESVERDRTRLRQRDLTLAVDRQTQAIGTATPHVHSNVVPHPKNVVGTDRKIHRQFVCISRTKNESIAAEAPQRSSSRWNLRVKITQRKQPVRIGKLYFLWYVLRRLESVCCRGRRARACALSATTLCGALGISTLRRGRLSASTLGGSLRIPALSGSLRIPTRLGVTTLGRRLGIVALDRGSLSGRLATAARRSCLTAAARAGSCPTSILSRQGFTQ